MKRRVVTAWAVVVTALTLFAAPAAAWDGHGHIESSDWNVPLTNIGLL